MREYKLLNNITGWAVFAVAAFTYFATIEPTASLWDCSEFITSAYKLEVGHPPGAPLFMMLGHIFTFFATSKETVAVMVNVFSALCSAFTILFLFWSITHLARKFIKKAIEEYTIHDKIAVMGSGIIGALAYAFSDSFWFSAVEGEVYAASSLFTAFVFWAVLKWEEEADQPYANRWLILLAYVTGLSIGVHLLNLLVVPAIVFVYYFKKYPISRKGIIYTTIVSIILLGCLIWGVIPLVPYLAVNIELLFVNSFGWAVNSGVLFYLFLLTAILVYAIYYTMKHNKVVANAILLGLSLCILGYGSYAMIVIRSSANPPMDQNNPDNIISLISYLNRDQYGSRPLFSGAYYSAPETKSELTFEYALIGDKYLKEDWKQTSTPYYSALFPRMYSTREDHVQVYEQYAKNKVAVTDSRGKIVQVPSFFDNIAYFWDYQLNFMYWRYFLWNFVGRQNDIQATKGDPTNGNWLSGINFIDEARLGPVDKDQLPQDLANNKGNNKYYFLPLILGLIGLFYQFSKDKKNFTIVTLLFFFTGIAIVLYLNQPPNEPRERDYSYVGSFYAFAVWIGLGVMALFEYLKKAGPKVAAIGAVLLGIPIPALMAHQNWDDHDRSGSYVATDFGYNYLNSCEPNALVYTYGDNDTFPLWYNQEVEGVRTDVRVANTMYLSADWYYKQMLRRAYDSAPLKSSGNQLSISASRRSVVYVKDNPQPRNIKQSLDFVMDDTKQVRSTSNIPMNVFPNSVLQLPIDKDYVLSNGITRPEDSASIVPYIQVKLPKDYIYKNNLAMVDFLGNNFPERPIYYGSDRSSYMGVDNNLRQVGMAFKLVPENVPQSNTGVIDIDATYDMLMNKYRFRGLNDPKVYLSETARRMTGYYRSPFNKLAAVLEIKGRKEELSKLLDRYVEVLPPMAPPYSLNTNPIVRYYYAVDRMEEGNDLARKLIAEYMRGLKYYYTLETEKHVSGFYEFHEIIRGMYELKSHLSLYKQEEVLKEIDSEIGSPFFKQIENRVLEELNYRKK